MKNMLQAVWYQLFPAYPKDTKILLTKNAKEDMGAWGIREDMVKSVILQGQQVNANMIAKQFQGFSIGTIAKYDRTTKTYLVLAVWKREWN